MLTGIATLWAWLVGSKLGRIVAAVAGALVAFFTLRAYWLRRGAQDERRGATERDRTNADQIRDRVRRAATADSLHDPEDRIFRD